MTGGVILGLWIFWSIALLVLYHKVFAVYYFNLGQGIMKELVMSCILGLIMAIVTVAFWYIAAAVIVLFGLGMMKKMDSKIPLVIAVIAAVIVCVVGISLKSDGDAGDGQSAINMEYTNGADYATYQGYVDQEPFVDDGFEGESTYEPAPVGGEFMTEKEREEADAQRAKENMAAAEWDEYTQNHFVTLSEGDPFADIDGQITRYDITAEIGFRDAIKEYSLEQEVYKKVNYSGLLGRLEVEYNNKEDLYSAWPMDTGRNYYVPNHIVTISWVYQGEERDRCLEIMENMVTLLEEKYGEYEKYYLDSEARTEYNWSTESENYCISFTNEDICYLRLAKTLCQNTYTDEEWQLRDEITENTKDYAVLNDMLNSLKQSNATWETYLSLYSHIYVGEYISEDGSKLTITENSENPPYYIVTFSDAAGAIMTEGFEAETNEADVMVYTMDEYGNRNEETQYIKLVESYVNDEFGESVGFEIILADDFSKLYVLQVGYPKKDFSGVYTRVGEWEFPTSVVQGMEESQ